MSDLLDEFFSRLTRAIAEGVAEGLASQQPASFGADFFGPVASVREPAVTAAPVEVNSTEWQSVETMDIKSGQRTFITQVNYPCKVKGLGRGGAIGSGYTIIAIRRRPMPTADIEGAMHDSRGEAYVWDYNVEVRKGRGVPSRTVKGDRIVYQRPKS